MRDVIDNTFYQDDNDSKLQEEFAFLRLDLGKSTDTPTPQKQIVPDSVEDILNQIKEFGNTLVLTLEHSSLEPITQMAMRIHAEVIRHYDLVQVDMSADEMRELQTLWQTLEEYGREMDTDISNGVMDTSLTLTLVPEAYSGAIVFAAENPVFWAMVAESIGQKTDRIRLMFTPESAGIYQTEAEGEISEERSDVQYDYDYAAYE